MGMVSQTNGKYLDIMIENKFKDTDDCALKDISYREMKNGEYILYADRAELLVVNREVALTVIEKDKINITKNKKLFEILKNNGFLIDEHNEINGLPKEPKNNIFRMLQIFLMVVFGLSVLLLLLYGSQKLIWNSLYIVPFDRRIFGLILIGISFSVGTTILHEFMHLIFSNNIKNIKRMLSISLKKSTAYVSLTHVWTWSVFSRLMAVSAGIMIDIVVLSILLVIGKVLNNEIETILMSIMFLRIIWQFGFHRKTDGKYFLMMLLDNPLIDIDYKTNRNVLTKKEVLAWRIACVIGKIIDLYLLFFWIMPIVYKTILWIGGRI
ncbi:MAG: hypothetical protein ACTTKP_04865 [Catonella sp.]|uniref:hypothetical protein n=1 Tax=Catonella sp. TaxID=2382125 RepID=UPI003FA17F42